MMASRMITTAWAPPTSNTNTRRRLLGSGAGKGRSFTERKAPVAGRVSAAMANTAQDKELRKPRPQNVAGEFYVDPFKKKKTAPVSPTPAPLEHASPATEEEEEGQQRKSRRCRSPKLRRRFLNALQHLGGDHVATPKQIKELMKVDELTNDEVKSHLQATHKKTSTSNTQQYKQPRSVHPCHQETATMVQTGTEMTYN